MEGLAACAGARPAVAALFAPLPPPPPVPGEALDVAIAGTAHAAHVVEPRRGMSAPAADDSRLALPPDARELFGHDPGCAEILAYDFAGAELLAACGALARDGRILAETRYLLSDADYREELSTHRPIAAFPAGKTAVLGFNFAHHNYFHWTMQCLPAMDAALRRDDLRDPVLVLPPLTAWQEETLALLGLDAAPRFEAGLACRYPLPAVRYSGFLNGSASFFVSPVCMDILDRMAARVDQPSGTPERLFVSRSDSATRVMTNEAEAARLAETYGFTTIVPGAYRVADQIRLFRGARQVVGAHGAGLTNLGFCRPGTRVLELFPEGYLNPVMNRIAWGRGLDYRAACFPDDGGPVPQLRTWRVDLARFERDLRALGN